MTEEQIIEEMRRAYHAASSFPYETGMAASGVKQMIYNSMHRDFERRYDVTVVQPMEIDGPPDHGPAMDGRGWCA
jgi:hypothetical protein